MRAAAYTRVSTEEQAEHGYSIDEQERLIREAIGQRGWQLFEPVFRDAGLSGARADRPALQAMLSSLDQVDVVVVWSMDRLTRDLGLFADLVRRLNAAHVAIECLTSAVDIGTPEGEAMAGVQAVFGQLERKKIGQRTSAALAARARQGGHTGGPRPFGYSWRDKRLVVDEAEAKIVRRIYHDYASGLGQRAIARALAAEGLRTGRATEWRQSSVQKILSNPLYKGAIEYKGELLSGKHEPIIEPELWARVEAIRTAAGVRKGGRSAHGGHLLVRGILRCGSCGEAMIPRKARSGVERERYVCRGRIERGPGFCNQPSIRRELVDGPLLESLLDHYVDMDATRARLEERTARALSAAREALAQAEAEVARRDESLARVERDYIDGKISAEKWQRLEVKLNAEREAAQAALQRAQSHAEDVEQAGALTDAEEIILRHLASLKRSVADGVEQTPNLDALRNVIGQIFESIELTRWPGFGSGRQAEGFTPPMDNPTVEGPDASYGLLPTLRWSAVDTETLNPIGHEIPVPEWQSYPQGFLCRYCWW